MFNFFISANVSDELIGSLEIFKNLRTLQEVKIKSKKFKDYRVCIDSATSLVQDVLDDLSTKGHSYTSFIDENPLFREEDHGIEQSGHRMSGVGILSQWGSNELIRYYLIDSKQKDPNGSFLTKFVISILSTEGQKQ